MDKTLAHLSDNDPVLAVLIERHAPPTFEKHTNYYHELVSSIIGQQLSVKAAATIEGRFKDLFGGRFPSPEEILTKNTDELRAVGLSRPKASYIQDLAMKIIDGTIDFSAIDSLSNQEIIDELINVKGIGIWTVHMFLMFCMARLDILPTGDLGIRNGIKQLYSLDHLPDPQEIEQLVKVNGWHPYESIASWYIWRSLENKP